MGWGGRDGKRETGDGRTTVDARRWIFIAFFSLGAEYSQP